MSKSNMAGARDICIFHKNRENLLWVQTYSGTLRHGSTISRIAAVSGHEYHLHLICISLTSVHVLALHMFCIER